jgi:hypothetical protein
MSGCGVSIGSAERVKCRFRPLCETSGRFGVEVQMLIRETCGRLQAVTDVVFPRVDWLADFR